LNAIPQTALALDLQAGSSPKNNRTLRRNGHLCVVEIWPPSRASYHIDRSLGHWIPARAKTQANDVFVAKARHDRSPRIWKLPQKVSARRKVESQYEVACVATKWCENEWRGG
jgi:hypothetical protein